MSGTLVPVSPHFHPHSDALLPGVIVAAAADVAHGISVTTEPFTDAEMPVTVAVTPPFASVLIAATYFVACDAKTSQPQPFARGAFAGPDWYTSVTEVRQALIPRITSDIFARIV